MFLLIKPKSKSRQKLLVYFLLIFFSQREYSYFLVTHILNISQLFLSYHKQQKKITKKNLLFFKNYVIIEM